MTSLWRGAMSDAAMRRPTMEIVAVVIDTQRDTIPAPAKRCSCCKETVSFAEWMANASRRPWTDLGIEIAEHECQGTLAEKINAAPVLLGTEQIGFSFDEQCGRDGCHGVLTVHGCQCGVTPPPCWSCTDGEVLECPRCGEMIKPCRDHDDCRQDGELARRCLADEDLQGPTNSTETDQ